MKYGDMHEQFLFEKAKALLDESEAKLQSLRRPNPLNFREILYLADNDNIVDHFLQSFLNGSISMEQALIGMVLMMSDRNKLLTNKIEELVERNTPVLELTVTPEQAESLEEAIKQDKHLRANSE